MSLDRSCFSCQHSFEIHTHEKIVTVGYLPPSAVYYGVLPFFVVCRSPPTICLLIERLFLPFWIHRRIRRTRPIEFPTLNRCGKGIDKRDHKRFVSSQSYWPTGPIVQGQKPAKTRIANPRFNWEDGASGLTRTAHFDLDVQSWPARTVKLSYAILQSLWFPV